MTDAINIEAVRIRRGTVRENLGDVDALAKSIAERGLIQPIVIDQRSFLLSGRRRLEAVRRLGMRTIPVVVVDNLKDASEVMAAQLAEPTERKSMVPSEQVTAARALDHLFPKRVYVPKGEGKPLSERRAIHNANRDLAAAAVGLGRSSLYYAGRIVEEAESGDEVALVSLKEMDASGLIRPIYHAMKDRKTRPPGESGHRVRMVRSTKPMEQRLVEVAAQLRGLTSGLDSLTEDDLTDVDAEARRRLETELRASSTRVNRFRRLLKGQA
jgi:hypothetical protein